MIWGARNLGMNGAGYAWLGTNLIYAALWLPLVHSRVDHILHRRWIYQDIAPGFGGALLGALLGGLIPISVARFELSVRLMIVFVLAVAMAWVGARFAGGRLARCKKELRKVSD